MVSRRHWFAAVVVLGLLFAAAPARAWNATGHQVAAEIAWRNLTPAVRAKVLELLKQHPHFERRLAPTEPDTEPVDYALRVFMRAATWPDMMRSGRADEKTFHHSAWHYVDFPIVAEGVDKATLELQPLGEKLEPGKQPENALQAMEWCVERLKNPEAPAAERAIALAWLEHLVGDIHQPLHASSFFSADYPKGDRGGNSFAVKYHGNVTNLHAFWDELLGGYMSARLVDAVADKVIEKYPRESMEKEVAVAKPAEWAAESFTIAKDVVYAEGKLKGVTREASVADKGETTPELPEKYDEAARETARRRIALAGYRLADLLNELFK
jgi:hypothetical protein